MQDKLMQKELMQEGLKQYLHIKIGDRTVVEDFLNNINASIYGTDRANDANQEVGFSRGLSRIDTCEYSGECASFIADQVEAYSGPDALLNPRNIRSFIAEKCCPGCEYFRNGQSRPPEI